MVQQSVSRARGRQGWCTSVVSCTNTQAPVTLFIKGERARKRVCMCVFVYKSLHANTKWTRAQLGLRCGPQQRKHDSDSHIQSFTHTSTHTPTHALTARPAPTRDGLAALLPWQTSDGWRAEKMKGRKGWWRRKRRWEGWGEGACMHARVVLEERKRAECSGLGAREDLTRGPSRSFPPRQHVSFPLNKQPFCGHERGWRSALSISPLSPLPLPPSVLLYLLYEPLSVCVWVGGVCIIYAY